MQIEPFFIPEFFKQRLRTITLIREREATSIALKQIFGKPYVMDIGRSKDKAFYHILLGDLEMKLKTKVGLAKPLAKRSHALIETSQIALALRIIGRILLGLFCTI